MNKSRLKLLFDASALLITWYFLSTYGPYDEQGNLIGTNILLAAILIGYCVFILVDKILLVTNISSKKSLLISALAAFSAIQILMVSSLNLVNWRSLSLLLVFNLVTAWYINRRNVKETD